MFNPTSMEELIIMKIVYASRMGKVEKLVNALSDDALKIENGN